MYETEAIKSPKEKLTRYRWENTNKLLGRDLGFIGCKTGITNAAGPCFAGFYERDGEKWNPGRSKAKIEEEICWRVIYISDLNGR